MPIYASLTFRIPAMTVSLDLSDKDRLILANQYEILSKLDENESDTYVLLAKSLRDGHKWLYQTQLENMLSENLSDEETQHVLDIAGLYGTLKDSYSRISDKSGIDEELLDFPGFDGNNEYELLNFANALVENGRYEVTLEPKGKNSHMPTTETYRRMIAKWRELGEPIYPFDRETIIAILEARTYLSQRTS
jgi:uncharacterized protein YfbU (UPF0304 family)